MRGIQALLLCAGLLLSRQVLADCAVTSGTVNLGSNSSTNIYGSQVHAQGSGGLNCSGVWIAVLTSNSVTVKILTTSNNMSLVDSSGSGDKIPYLIYPDSNYQYPYTVGQTINYGSLNLISLIFTSTNVSIPLYIQTTAGANVRAGTYTDTINLSWTYNICHFGVAACLNSWSDINVLNSVAVTAVVTKDCLIGAADNINFGSMALVGQFNPITQSINLTCTKTEGYNTYFTAGNNPVTGWRQMKSGTSNYLQYQIYLPGTTTVWDSNNKQSGSGTGLTQPISYKAAINPAQPEQAVGTYQDNLSFVVEY